MGGKGEGEVGPVKPPTPSMRRKEVDTTESLSSLTTSISLSSSMLMLAALCHQFIYINQLV